MTGIIQSASFFDAIKAQYLNSIITSIAVEIHVVLYDLDDCSMLK